MCTMEQRKGHYIVVLKAFRSQLTPQEYPYKNKAIVGFLYKCIICNKVFSFRYAIVGFIASSGVSALIKTLPIKVSR